MVVVRMEGLIPIDRRELWRLLGLHMDERTLREIHPWIKSGRIVRDEGITTFEEQSFPITRVVEREIRVVGRPLRNVWTYRIRPPSRFDYEIRAKDGSLQRFLNVYEEVPGGMRVSTEADVWVRRLPSFLTKWFVLRYLERADREDLSFLAREPKGR